MKRFYRASVCSLLLGLMVLTLMLPLPVYAVGDATSVTIVNGRVFENVWETGDQLYIVQYDIDYATLPTEYAYQTFVFQIYDGASLKAQKAVSAYGNYICAIYKDAADVAAEGFVWGSGYTIRVGGNPLVAFPSGFDASQNKAERLLSAGYWQTGTLGLTIPPLLGAAIIIMSESVGTRTVGLLDWLTDENLLNSAGAIVWSEEVEGIEEVAGDYFSTHTITPGFTRETMPTTAQTTFTGFESPRLKTALNNLGTWIGIPGAMIGGVGLLIIFFVGAGRVYASTGSVPISVVAVSPLLFLGNVLGLIEFAVMWALVIVILVVFGVTFIMGRFA